MIRHVVNLEAGRWMPLECGHYKLNVSGAWRLRPIPPHLPVADCLICDEATHDTHDRESAFSAAFGCRARED